MEPEHALGRQLYALRRWSGTNTYKLSGSKQTALEGRLLRSWAYVPNYTFRRMSQASDRTISKVNGKSQ